MIVVDTHAWLWWVNGESGLSESASREIARAGVIGVTTISAMEVVTLVRRHKIELDTDARSWIARALALERVQELPVTAEIAGEAGSFGDEFVGDPADRIIYATAIVTGSKLVTRDRFLRGYDPVRTVW
ncbi:MAG TPA: type II toxin-antitoxin system VapC family toxin [Gaiellaceae bacterium]|nr:type II toxin-antitoxin system VapC family toxin [Gaiellaceae bacterium]